jgi:hypothetical protein
MGRIPARHARMHIFTRIGVFRLSGTAFGTTAWHELSPKFERKHQTDKCDGEGDDSTAKEQESAHSKLVLELVPREID